MREPGFKLNEAGLLFDMKDAPFVEKEVAATDDTEESSAARKCLAAALADLNPAAGKTDKEGAGNGNRKAGGRSRREMGLARPAHGKWVMNCLARSAGRGGKGA